MKRLMVALVMVGLLAGPALSEAKKRKPPKNPTTVITNTNSSRNTNRNTNLNLNVNKNSVRSKNVNRNTNRNVNNNLNVQSQGQGQEQDQAQSQSQVGINIQDQGQAQSTENANNSSQAVTFITPRPAASSAYSAALTSGNDTCMGSTSVGGQGYAFGFSIGSTWTDSNCIRLKNANALSALGLQGAALSILAMDDDVAAALKANGIRYSSLHPTKVVEAPVKVSSSHTFVDGVDYGIDFEVMSD